LVYTIVERKELDRVLTEMELSLSGMVDEKTAVQIGKLSGAAYILLSSLRMDEGMFYLSMRIVSVETGRVIRTSIKKTDSFDYLESLTEEVIEYLLDFDFDSLYGKSFIIIRNFISTGIGLEIPITLGDVTSVWGTGFSLALYCSYNLAFEWGIIGYGAVIGTNILPANPEVIYKSDLYACPLAVTVKYETNLNMPVFGYAEAAGGISLLIVNYKEDYGITRDPAGKPFLSLALGGGYRITQNINISLSGNINLIFMDNTLYTDVTPALRAGFYF